MSVREECRGDLEGEGAFQSLGIIDGGSPRYRRPVRELSQFLLNEAFARTTSSRPVRRAYEVSFLFLFSSCLLSTLIVITYSFYLSELNQ